LKGGKMTDLKSEISEIKELLREDKKKEKKFRLPWLSKVGRSKAKKNYVTIQRIQTNGECTFKKVQIDDQTFMEEDIPRLAGAGYVLRYKKNPLIILPEWSVEPFSPLENYEKSLINGTNSAGYRLLLNKMKLEVEGVKTKKKMGNILPWIIGIIVLGVVVYAFMTGGV
jgi:DNA-binding protein YbaB